MSKLSRAGLLVLLLVGLGALACGPLGGGAINQAQQTLEAAGTQIAAAETQQAGGGGILPTTGPEQPTVEGAPTATPTYDAIAAQLTVPPMLTALASTATLAPGSLRQWAIAAQASSQYGDPDFGAVQASGAPNVYPNCGDNAASWASAGSNTAESLTLVYQTPVVPMAVNIYETSKPGSIVQVEVVDDAGATHIVYQGMPLASEECPRIFSVGISGIAAKVSQVIVRIDQSVLGTWDEIDAVELIGNP